MDAYVYGVVAAAGDWSPSSEGVDGQPVELVERGGLAALTSDAPPVPVRANRRNPTPPSNVLPEAVAERWVLPMQFGVVLPDREAVRGELLGAHADRLAAQLDVFEPYVELGVRIVCPEDVLLRTVIAERAEIADLRADIEGRPPEATYYDRIRLGGLVPQAIADKRQAITEVMTAPLQPAAAADAPGVERHEA